MLRSVVGRPHAWLVHFAEPFPWLMAAAYEVANRWFGTPNSFNIDKIREALADCWACSSALAERELGFRVSAPLLDQLRDTAQWYREHRWL